MTAKHEDKHRKVRKSEDKVQRRSRRHIRPTSKADEARKDGVVGLPNPSAISPRRSSRSLVRQVEASAVRAMASGRQQIAARSDQPEATAPKVSYARGFLLPNFGPDTFLIYDWPLPRPQTFPAISDTYRTWKIARDKFEGDIDVDDGADDWYRFAGNLDDHVSPRSFLYAITSVFLARAKRAFRAGRIWAKFEQKERSIDVSGMSRKICDPVARAKWIREILDNDLRLAIFDTIAARLCNEIWLEEYVAVDSSQSKRDSKVEFESSQLHKGAFEQPAEVFVPQGSSCEDDTSGRLRPKAWLRDPHGMWQPIYAQEMHLPNGLNGARKPLGRECNVCGPTK
nr:hypothetical protein CFP56_16811 [Quercus suber]